eukprot:5534522-Pyramimonas_sp.AAC.1
MAMSPGPRVQGPVEGRGGASPRLSPLGPGGRPPPLAPGLARRADRRRWFCPPSPGPPLSLAVRGKAPHLQRRLAATLEAR